jgi:hypothetical protein
MALLLAVLAPNVASAQQIPVPQPVGIVADTPLVPVAAPAPLPVPAPTPVEQPVELAPAPPKAAERETGTHKLVAEVGTRVALRAQNPAAPSKLNDVGSDGEIDVVLSGHVRPALGWQAGFLGNYGASTGAATAALLDLVGKVELADAFNIWIGRMPIPSDRSSLSTVWSVAPWTLPGTYVRLPQTPVSAARPFPGPRRGDNDRGDGATLWGQFWGGALKYYAGAFGLDQPQDTSPLLSARISLSLLDPEPGYRTRSSYYGSKDVFAIGVGAQHQKGGSIAPANVTTEKPGDFNLVSADALLEKNGGSAGVLDLEAASAKAWGPNEVVAYQFFVLASYLVPVQIGVGRFQPLLRFQHAAAGEGADSSDFTSVDAQLGYLIDGYNARLLGAYQYTSMTGQKQNAILFGLQIWAQAQ